MYLPKPFYDVVFLIGVDLTVILAGRMASAEGGRIEGYEEEGPLRSRRPSIFVY